MVESVCGIVRIDFLSHQLLEGHSIATFLHKILTEIYWITGFGVKWIRLM